MESYREKLKVQNVILVIGCVVLAAFCVLGFLGEAGVVKLAPSVGDGHWQSRWRGFISGASFGILVLLLALRKPIEKAEGTEADKRKEETGV